MGKIYFAGVPGGGKPGDCVRERDLSFMPPKKTPFLFSFTPNKGNNHEKQS
jgi:hypothetical protein